MGHGQLSDLKIFEWSETFYTQREKFNNIATGKI